jgi:hypothetical protein
LNSIYEGFWRNDKKNGVGVLHLNNQYTFSGAFRDDKKNGIGKLYYRDGTMLEGAYHNDVLDGKFTKYRVTGEVILKGKLHKGKLEEYALSSLEKEKGFVVKESCEVPGFGKLKFFDDCWYVGVNLEPGKVAGGTVATLWSKNHCCMVFKGNVGPTCLPNGFGKQ